MVPLLPAGVATAPPGTCDAVTPCRETPLYLHAGDGARAGLSTLPGDAMASDATTVYRSAGAPGPALLALSNRFEAPITLARDMQLRLPDLQFPGGAPWGDVTVVARMASSNVTLAHVALRPSSEDSIHAIVLRAANETADDAVSTVNNRSAVTVVALFRDAVCAINVIACDQITGRWGANTVRFCSDRHSANIIMRAASEAGWAFQDNLNSTGAPVTFCGAGLVDQLSPAARDVDDATPSVLREVEAPPVGPASSPRSGAPSDPRVISLHASAPAWIPQDETSLTLPSGVQLGVIIQLAGRETEHAGSGASTATTFTYGKPNSPTALVVSTSTPRAFAMLTKGAEAIGPGTHTSTFSNTSDADVYAFHVPAAGKVRVAPVGSVVAVYALYDADGTPRNPRDADIQPGAGDATWILRVSQPPNNVPRGEYAFTLTIDESAADPDDAPLDDGERLGTLGAEDDRDAPTLFLWRGQRADVWLDAIAGDLRASFRVDGAINVTSPEEGHLVLRAKSTASYPIRVQREAGEGTYRLTVARDPAGNLSDVPALSPLPHPFGTTSRWEGLAGVDQDGVVVFGSTSNGTGMYRLTPTNATFLVESESYSSFGRTAAGDPVVVDVDWDTALPETWAHVASIVRPGGDVPLAEAITFALGPDESLYTVVWGKLMKTSADRSVTTLATNVSLQFSISPGGALYLTPSMWGAPALVLEPNGTTRARTPLEEGLLAFDGAGRGYRMLEGALVEQVDLDTGARRIVARLPEGSDEDITDLKIAEGRVYAGSRDSLYYADAPVPGWSGFHPALDMAPLPDLTITRVEDRAVDLLVDERGLVEVHEVSVDVLNHGDAPIGTFTSRLRVICNVCEGGSRYVTHGGLGPGDAATLVFRIEYEASGGDVSYRAWANDVPKAGRPMEASFTDNARSAEGYVVVGGPERACRTALDLAAC